MTFVLGITGSIATGKSTVVEVFRGYGFPIVDGDQIARKIVEPGQPALKAIVATFGPQVLQTDGQLDRQKLGELIFHDPDKRQQLDEVMEPFLRTAILYQIQQAKTRSRLVVVDMPLMYERAYDQYMDQVAVVYTSPKIQLERLIKRDQISAEKAQQKIASQQSIEVKRQKADILFDNQGSRQATQRQVRNWLFAEGFIDTTD